MTAGNFSMANAQVLGGDGIGTHLQPVQVLLVGQNKRATVSNASTLYGLLYNRSGGLVQSGSSTIRGGVLLGSGYSASNSCTVRYDGDVLDKLIHSALSFTVSFVSNGGSEIEPCR